MDSNTPNFNLNIPSEVAYDFNLHPGAILTYAEIKGLCKKTGECWAENEYLANLRNVSERTIQRFLKELEDNNHIIIFFNKAGKQDRRIKLTKPTTELSQPTTNLSQPYDKSVVSSIYSINTSINTPEKAVFFLLQNYAIRFEQEFLMPYEKQFKTEELFNRFLEDFNDEADMKARAFGDWLIAMLTKYARNWLDSKKRFEVIRNDEPQPVMMPDKKVI